MKDFEFMHLILISMKKIINANKQDTPNNTYITN